jgi:hypothetical protein
MANSIVQTRKDSPKSGGEIAALPVHWATYFIGLVVLLAVSISSVTTFIGLERFFQIAFLAGVVTAIDQGLLVGSSWVLGHRVMAGWAARRGYADAREQMAISGLALGITVFFFFLSLSLSVIFSLTFYFNNQYATRDSSKTESQEQLVQKARAPGFLNAFLTDLERTVADNKTATVNRILASSDYISWKTDVTLISESAKAPDNPIDSQAKRDRSQRSQEIAAKGQQQQQAQKKYDDAANAIVRARDDLKLTQEAFNKVQSDLAPLELEETTRSDKIKALQEEAKKQAEGSGGRLKGKDKLYDQTNKEIKDEKAALTALLQHLGPMRQQRADLKNKVDAAQQKVRDLETIMSSGRPASDDTENRNQIAAKDASAIAGDIAEKLNLFRDSPESATYKSTVALCRELYGRELDNDTLRSKVEKSSCDNASLLDATRGFDAIMGVVKEFGSGACKAADLDKISFDDAINKAQNCVALARGARIDEDAFTSRIVHFQTSFSSETSDYYKVWNGLSTAPLLLAFCFLLSFFIDSVSFGAGMFNEWIALRQLGSRGKRAFINWAPQPDDPLEIRAAKRLLEVYTPNSKGGWFSRHRFAGYIRLDQAIEDVDLPEERANVRALLNDLVHYGFAQISESEDPTYLLKRQAIDDLRARVRAASEKDEQTAATTSETSHDTPAAPERKRPPKRKLRDLLVRNGEPPSVRRGSDQTLRGGAPPSDSPPPNNPARYGNIRTLVRALPDPKNR